MRLEDLQCLQSYESLGEGFFSYAEPRPFEQMHLAAFNPDAARLIGLDESEAQRPEFVEYFGGKRLLKGSRPLAMRYTGHQFGVYNPDIGDGRAILLGELAGGGGPWDLHLKGGGRTAYARVFDGRAVLRSCIREYLCGEAMHGLGIPTTRSLCIIGGNEKVERERMEPGAMLLRMAESHIRFGSFEALYYKDETDNLRRLADYVIERHYPQVRGAANPALALLETVTRRTARLIAAWQAAGFSHGVMNTDNMSIAGLTLDYGPFGFMEQYEPGLVCNHSDHHGRYAFNRQPPIALWNLTCLAQALSPLTGREEAVEVLEVYIAEFENRYLDLMRKKLGLFREEPEDASLAGDLLKLLEAEKCDYTVFFRSLSSFKKNMPETDSCFSLPDGEGFRNWSRRYSARLLRETAGDRERQESMNRANPKYILRNYMAQIVIEKAESGDCAPIERMRRLLASPFDEHPDMEKYAGPSPDWAKNIVVSCSS